MRALYIVRFYGAFRILFAGVSFVTISRLQQRPGNEYSPSSISDLHKCAHSIARHKKSSEDPVTGTFPNVVIDQIVILFLDLSAHLPLGMYCNKFPVVTWCRGVLVTRVTWRFFADRARVQLSHKPFYFLLLFN
jgi:hypothetical protein